LTDDGQMRGSLYLRDIDLGPLNATLDAVDEACRDTGCYAAGDLVSYAEYSNKVPTALLSSLSLCLVLVGLIVAMVSKATGRVGWVRVLAAAFWGPACLLVVLWIFQVPVNFLTCVFASVLVGLTGDNAIQYLFAGHGTVSRGIEQRGGASIQVALIMALVCLCFLGSAFVPSRRLGLLLALGVVASLIGDIWILRALARRS
jgi:predicted RND superfamily exporter protein